MLTADDNNDDGILLLTPISCGRDGPGPLIIRQPSLRDEAHKITELLSDSHKQGHAWSDTAVICRDYATMEEFAHALKVYKLPHQVRKCAGDYKPDRDAINVLTMRVRKGLEFPVVMLLGVGRMPTAGEEEKEEASVFYGCYAGHAEVGG